MTVRERFLALTDVGAAVRGRTMTAHEPWFVAPADWCDECQALGCGQHGEACDCTCHEEAVAAQALGLSVVREETDSGGDPRPRLYP